ncbi:F0F1 ATP synthase subunit epsilon [Cellulomonas alba]|uniref:ATP synthase epsilon chain n=1 Tax=Cellulomonas alba TaxID=3053467 RepID=A0ABT7SHW3_9CELL|nr:F0F1 ATP synthase subunit epsilon [Cellulomonas alba]MDM7855770.1 F0F1 ATP synthase subunit epsilon [Cellulomonas alba]
MATIEVDLVATDGKVWSGVARQVIAPAGDGEIGILAGHTPVLTVLKPGEIRVYAPESGEPARFTVEGGFLSFDSNVMTIVVDEVTAGPTTDATAR